MELSIFFAWNYNSIKADNWLQWFSLKNLEAAKLLALHAYVLMCQCALHAYMLICLHTTVHCVLTCHCALRTYVLTCQRAFIAYVLMLQCVLDTYVLTCQSALCAYALMCQCTFCAPMLRYQRTLSDYKPHVCLCTHMSLWLASSCGHLPTCLEFLASHSYVTLWSPANMLCLISKSFWCHFFQFHCHCCWSCRHLVRFKSLINVFLR